MKTEDAKKATLVGDDWLAGSPACEELKRWVRGDACRRRASRDGDDPTECGWRVCGVYLPAPTYTPAGQVLTDTPGSFNVHRVASVQISSFTCPVRYLLLPVLKYFPHLILSVLFSHFSPCISFVIVKKKMCKRVHTTNAFFYPFFSQ